MAITRGGDGGKGARVASQGGSGGGLAARINFTKPPGSGLSVVRVDVAKMEASLGQTPSFHVGTGGTGQGAIGGRYAEATRFLNTAATTGKPVHMTRVYVDKAGHLSIGDGRHRFAVLRDSGARTIPVAVPRSNAAKLRRLFGAG